MSSTLSESESRRIVAAHGVPVSPFVTGATSDEVIEAVRDDSSVTYPVVAKLCGRAIAHKTERGLVRLHVVDETALRVASDELLAAATADDGDVEILVSSMLAGNRELIAGLNDDPQFGLTIMLGIGGVLAEAIRDVTFRLVPITTADASEMIDDLRTQALLGEFRGEPEVDRAALVNTLTALAAAGEAQPGLRSVDLNPLIVVDGRPVAVDALVEIGDVEIEDDS